VDVHGGKRGRCDYTVAYNDEHMRHPDILELSHHSAYICHHSGIGALTVINVKTITAVVSMVPGYQVTFEGISHLLFRA
jgi:hypothetical protein